VKRVKSVYYELIVSIFEKYGYNVVESSDKKTMYVSKHPSPQSVPFTEIEELFLKENLDEYIDAISPVHIASWKICLI